MISSDMAIVKISTGTTAVKAVVGMAILMREARGKKELGFFFNRSEHWVNSLIFT